MAVTCFEGETCYVDLTQLVTMNGHIARSYSVSDAVSSGYTVLGTWVSVPTSPCGLLYPIVSVTTRECLFTFPGFTFTVYCKGNVHFGPILTVWTRGNTVKDVPVSLLDSSDSPLASIDSLWGYGPATYTTNPPTVHITIQTSDLRIPLYALIGIDLAEGYLDVIIIPSFTVAILPTDLCGASGEMYRLELAQRVSSVSDFIPKLRYLVTGPVTGHWVSGVVEYENPLSDFSFTYTVLDPYGNQVSDSVSVTISLPFVLHPPSPDLLIAYTGLPWQLPILTSGGTPPISITSVTSPFTYTSLNVVEWSSPTNTLSPVALTVTVIDNSCDLVTSSFTVDVTVLTGIPPVFRPFDGSEMQCYEGEMWTVGLGNYLYHVYFSFSELVTSVTGSPAGMYVDASGTLTWLNPVAGPASISLQSCSPENYCSSSLYSLTCVPPVTVTISNLPTDLYIGQELHELTPIPIVTVHQSGTQCTTNILSLSLVLPKPEGLMVDQAGYLWWKPGFADVYSFTIKAELTGNPTAIGLSSTVSITVLANSIPSFTLLRPLKSHQQCLISLLTDACSLDIMTTLQPIDADNDVITCTSDVYTVTGNVLTWDRSLESTTSPSAPITVRCDDAHSAFIYSLSFRLYPDFLPVISDLIPNDLTATVGTVWMRSFTVTAGTIQYPTDASQVLSVEVVSSLIKHVSPGDLTFNPPMGSEGSTVSLTISVVWTGYVSIPVTATYTISVDSTPPQYPVCSPLTTLEKTLLMSSPPPLFSLDLTTKCSSPVSHPLQFALKQAPPDVHLTSSILTWSPTTPETRIQVTISVKDLVYTQEIITFYVFDVIPRCDFTFNVLKLRAKSGERYRTRVELDAYCALYRHMMDFGYGMTVSGPNLTPPIPEIDPNYGLITWDVPMDFSYIGEYVLTVTLTEIVDVGDPANIKTQSFSLLLDPRIDLGIPVPSPFTTTASPWSATFHCQSSVLSPTFTLITTSPRVTFSSGIVTYTPLIGEYASDVVRLECSDGVVTSTYSFLISPVKQVTSPVLTPQSFTVTEDQLNIGGISWSDVDSFPQEVTVFMVNAVVPSGFYLHKWGYFYYIPPQGGVESVIIEVNDGISSQQASIDFTITEVNDAPYLPPIPPVYIDRLQGQTSFSFTLSPTDEETPSLAVHYTYKDSLGSDLNTVSSPMEFLWTPEFDVSHREVDVWVVDAGGLSSNMQSTLLCQGVECRIRPEILTVTTTDPACTQSGTRLISCWRDTPEHVVIIQVSGYNLDTGIFVGYRECGFVASSVTGTDLYVTVTCELPYPSPIGRKTFIYGETSGLTGFAKDYIEYSLPPVPTLIPYLQPTQKLLLYGSGTLTVPIHGTDINPRCTCYASVDGLIESLTGVFDYMGSQYSTCSFTNGVLTVDLVYYIRLNCGEIGVTTSTSIPFVYLNLQVLPGISPITTGHDHGGYTIPIQASGLSVCYEDFILVSFLGHTIKPVFFCDDNMADIQLPAYESTWGSRVITVTLSVNGGWSYTEPSNSFIFTYTGICPDGSYVSGPICSPCPSGYKCPISHSNYYLQSAIPCDLGSYQPSPSQSTCIPCEPGYQCFCIGLTDHILCDAGFVCATSGIIRRSEPCPPGYYCKAGTSDPTLDLTSTDLPYPIPCPQASYCKIGAYDSSIDLTDPYRPQPCSTGFFCPSGSSNSFVSY